MHRTVASGTHARSEPVSEEREVGNDEQRPEDPPAAAEVRLRVRGAHEPRRGLEPQQRKGGTGGRPG